MAARSRVKRSRRPALSRSAIGRGVAVSLTLGELACSSPAELPPAKPVPALTAAPAATSAAPVVVVPPAPPPAPDPSPVLSAFAVTNTTYARRVLYTWTSIEQVQEIGRTGVLLSRSESPQFGKAYYDRVMESGWMAGDKIAALLRSPAFLKARFAWPAAWATLLGWPGETYGTQLVEVTLKPEAWVAMYRTSLRTWEVRDMSGAVIPTDELFKRPDRLAAVHFVHDAISMPNNTGATVRASAGDGREAYREYVLCNESMIESWSVATESILTHLSASADLLDATAKYFEQHPPPAQREDRWNAHVAMIVWTSLVPATAAKELYEASLAFPNPNYVIEPEPIAKLASTLRLLQQSGKPTIHRPTMLFPGAKPVSVPPPPPPPPPGKINNKKWRGTFG